MDFYYLNMNMIFMFSYNYLFNFPNYSQLFWKQACRNKNVSEQFKNVNVHTIILKYLFYLSQSYNF